MPDELDEIRQRLDSLESRLNSEAGLRAMMDLDQASLTMRLDAQDNLLRALAVTQSEHTSRFRRVEEGLGGVESRLGGVESRLGGVESRLTGVEDRLTRVDGTVTRVETGIKAILALLREDH